MAGYSRRQLNNVIFYGCRAQGLENETCVAYHIHTLFSEEYVHMFLEVVVGLMHC